MPNRAVSSRCHEFTRSTLSMYFPFWVRTMGTSAGVIQAPKYGTMKDWMSVYEGEVRHILRDVARVAPKFDVIMAVGPLICRRRCRKVGGVWGSDKVFCIVQLVEIVLAKARAHAQMALFSHDILRRINI